eukprot:COSAG01_NODE_4817_length_4724_cov_3.025081_6_plen_79_part_00
MRACAVKTVAVAVAVAAGSRQPRAVNSARCAWHRLLLLISSWDRSQEELTEIPLRSHILATPLFPPPRPYVRAPAATN